MQGKRRSLILVFLSTSLLISACDRTPESTAVAVSTAVAEPRAYGRFVPERQDDFAWENDKVAFRVYGPSSPAKGPISGVDAWFKRVNYPIIDKWYARHLEGRSYHEDYGEGYDRYHTGTSRGVGGSALWIEESAYPPASFDSYEIVDSDNGAFAFILDYAWTTPIGAVTERKMITLNPGEHLYRARSEFAINGEPAAMPVAVGLTTHDGAAATWSDKTTGRISTWEIIDGHGVGTGALVDPAVLSDVVVVDSEEKDESHIWLITSSDEKGILEYRAGFVWERSGDMRRPETWNAYLDAR